VSVTLIVNDVILNDLLKIALVMVMVFLKELLRMMVPSLRTMMMMIMMVLTMMMMLS
jgi:hypothetical protein